MTEAIEVRLYIQNAYILVDVFFERKYTHTHTPIYPRVCCYF